MQVTKIHHLPNCLETLKRLLTAFELNLAIFFCFEYIPLSTPDSRVRIRCRVSMLKMLVCPVLNDATMRLGSLLTRSTEEGIPISRKQCREHFHKQQIVLKKKIEKEHQAFSYLKSYDYEMLHFKNYIMTIQIDGLE